MGDVVMYVNMPTLQQRDDVGITGDPMHFTLLTQQNALSKSRKTWSPPQIGKECCALINALTTRQCSATLGVLCWSKGHKRRLKLTKNGRTAMVVTPFGVSINGESPEWLVYSGESENPTQMDDFGLPAFMETYHHPCYFWGFPL